MVFHLTAASHDVSSHRIKNTVACTACNVHRFQDVNVVARHLCVSYKEASCCQRSKSASYQICMLVIYAFRFLWAGKCFVVTVCIINALAVFLIFAALCIAVIRVYVCFCDLFLFAALVCQNCCSWAPAAASAAIPNTECFFFDIKITTFLKFAVTLFPAICVYSCFNFSNQLLSFLSFVS